MNMNRRQALALTAGGTIFAVSVLSVKPSFAAVEDTEKAIMAISGDKIPEMGKVSLTAPEIAENGNTVPISVSVDSEMTGSDMVESVSIFAEGNPNPDVITFNFTAMSGSATATTRMRLAKTQNVIAVVKMADGSTYMDKKQVKVTIGGCGG